MTIRLEIDSSACAIGDRVLQGAFDLQALNLLFVFQVNCTGCFLYGFPLVNALYWQYRDLGLNVLGLSTAFEDFDYNTAANTELLLTQQQTVGETCKAIGEKYPQAIDFPIAVDRLTTGAELATPSNIDFLSANNNLESLSIAEQSSIRQNMITDLQKITQVSATFTLNQLPGTPTFLLIDQNLELLDGWFGHIPEAEVNRRITRCLSIVRQV
jgi:hypothetical protein